MQIHSLKVSSFRLFEDKQLHFDRGINLLTGHNAVGKTSLLEALYLLMTGRSFRASHLSDLIRLEDPFFRIESHFEKNGIDQSLRMTFDRQEKRLQYNSTELLTAVSLIGILQGVLLAPHDIDLVKGAPQGRRQYVDLQIAQVDPLYVHHLVRYTRGVKQRNWMLRTKQLQALDVYESQLARSTAYLIARRKNLVAALEQEMCEVYPMISGKSEPLALCYESSLGIAETEEEIVLKLAQVRHRDLELCSTNVGPHRDELKILLHHKEAKQFASEGEMRSLAAALRLAEWRQMRKTTLEEPLLFVDDIGISLDQNRLKNLSQIFDSLGQVIVTSTDPILNQGRVHHIDP